MKWPDRVRDSEIAPTLTEDFLQLSGFQRGFVTQHKSQLTSHAAETPAGAVADTQECGHQHSPIIPILQNLQGTHSNF